MNPLRLLVMMLFCTACLHGPRLALCSEQKDVPEPVCATDFESRDELGLYDRLLRDKLVKVVKDEGVEGSKALQVTYRGNDRGSARVVNTFRLPEPLNEATLVFDVKFDEDFQFTKGGKLHGLGPDHRVTGGNEVTPEGWSARAMWHRKSLDTYVYCQDKEKKYGQGPDRKSRFKFKTERYYSVCIYVKINDPVDEANGLVQIYVNGKGVAEDRDIQFRAEDGDHTKITHLLFSTFHGGDSDDWAPKDRDGNYLDVHAYFDNFAVYEGLHVRKEPGKP